MQQKQKQTHQGKNCSELNYIYSLCLVEKGYRNNKNLIQIGVSVRLSDSMCNEHETNKSGSKKLLECYSFLLYLSFYPIFRNFSFSLLKQSEERMLALDFMVFQHIAASNFVFVLAYCSDKLLEHHFGKKYEEENAHLFNYIRANRHIK